MAPFDTNFFGFMNFGKMGDFITVVNAFIGSMHTMSQLEWMGVITIGLGVAVLAMAGVGMINQLAAIQVNRRTS